MGAPWVCAACRRRVPGYVEVCHCGATRPAPVVTPSPSAPVQRAVGHVGLDPRQVPWPVWAALGVMGAAVLGAAISLLFVPSRPQPTVPLLGYVDRAPEPQVHRAPQRPVKPSPSPARRRAPLRQ